MSMYHFLDIVSRICLPQQSNTRPDNTSGVSDMVNENQQTCIKEEPGVSSSEKLGSYECTICSITFKYDDELISHSYKNHLKCPQCPKYFMLFEGLRLHLKTCLCKCETCGKVYKSRLMLDRHVRAMHEEKIHKCSVCDKVFTTLNLLKKHTSSLHKDRCDICNKIFRHRRSLKSHVKVRHGDTEISEDDRHFHEQVNKCQCPLCNISFTTSLELKTHAADVHQQKTEFTCPLCPSIFYWKRALEVHMPIVHPSQKYSCSICAKTYQEKYTLKEHIKSIHHIIRDKKCPKCPEVFSTSSQLRIHKINTHGTVVKRRICSVCQKRFNTPSQLLRHVKYVHTMMASVCLNS